jgi:hypothetical protein
MSASDLCFKNAFKEREREGGREGGTRATERESFSSSLLVLQCTSLDSSLCAYM